ncbi:YceI family protein [Lysobacter humi (ex Lee et al. 2017)]
MTLQRLLLAPLLLATTFGAHAADYLQAAGSTLTFTARYQGEAFTGRFPTFATRLSFDPAKLAQSRLDVTIPLAGATTADGERDSYLRGADFFNVAKFPQARFVATKFRALGGGRYVADGQLSLRGATRPVTLVFSWTPGARPVLAGQAKIKRLDFGVGGGEWVDTDLIANEVAIATRVVLAPAK